MLLEPSTRLKTGVLQKKRFHNATSSAAPALKPKPTKAKKPKTQQQRLAIEVATEKMLESPVHEDESTGLSFQSFGNVDEAGYVSPASSSEASGVEVAEKEAPPAPAPSSAPSSGGSTPLQLPSSSDASNVAAPAPAPSSGNHKQRRGKNGEALADRRPPGLTNDVLQSCQAPCCWYVGELVFTTMGQLGWKAQCEAAYLSYHGSSYDNHILPTLNGDDGTVQDVDVNGDPVQYASAIAMFLEQSKHFAGCYVETTDGMGGSKTILNPEFQVGTEVVLGVTITAESLSWKGAGHAGQQAKLRLHRTIVLYYYLCCIAYLLLLYCIIFVMQYFFTITFYIFLPRIVLYSFVLCSQTIFLHSTFFIVVRYYFCTAHYLFCAGRACIVQYNIFVALYYFCCAAVFLLYCIIFCCPISFLWCCIIFLPRIIFTLHVVLCSGAQILTMAKKYRTGARKLICLQARCPILAGVRSDGFLKEPAQAGSNLIKMDGPLASGRSETDNLNYIRAYHFKLSQVLATKGKEEASQDAGDGGSEDAGDEAAINFLQQEDPLKDGPASLVDPPSDQEHANRASSKRPSLKVEKMMDGVPEYYQPEGNAYLIFVLAGPRSKVRWGQDPSRLLMGHALPSNAALSAKDLRRLAGERKNAMRKTGAFFFSWPDLPSSLCSFLCLCSGMGEEGQPGPRGATRDEQHRAAMLSLQLKKIEESRLGLLLPPWRVVVHGNTSTDGIFFRSSPFLFNWLAPFHTRPIYSSCADRTSITNLESTHYEIEAIQVFSITNWFLFRDVQSPRPP